MILTLALAIATCIGGHDSPNSQESSITNPRSGTVITNETLKRSAWRAAEGPVVQSLQSLTPEQKAWALATAAVLTERNRRRHDILGELEPTEQNIEIQKQSLIEWWGVQSRDDLLNTLKWIEEGGHRQDFEKLGGVISPLDDEQYLALLVKTRQNEEALHQIVIVRKYYQYLGAKGLLGWDYSRYVSLCRWGYLVGYLTEEEAWSGIMPVARKLQRTFDSWKDLGENYLIGREFWSSNQSRRNGQLYRDTYQKLLYEPQSPWNHLSWNTPLP